MLYGNVEGHRVFIDDFDKTGGQVATCPCCDTPLVPRKGELKAHHFAHTTKNNCEHWTEPMTKWHVDWQLTVPPECREVRMQKGEDKHIADIVLPDGVVVEVQHSPISSSEVKRREDFYGDMIWIVDGIENTSFEGVYEGTERSAYLVKGGRQWWFTCSKRVVVDTGGGLVLITGPRGKATNAWAGFDVKEINSHLSKDTLHWLQQQSQGNTDTGLPRIDVVGHKAIHPCPFRYSEYEMYHYGFILSRADLKWSSVRNCFVD